MSIRLLFVKFNTAILGIIMLITGFTVLLFDVAGFLLHSIIISLAGLFLISIHTEKR